MSAAFDCPFVLRRAPEGYWAVATADGAYNWHFVGVTELAHAEQFYNMLCEAYRIGRDSVTKA